MTMIEPAAAREGMRGLKGKNVLIGLITAAWEIDQARAAAP